MRIKIFRILVIAVIGFVVGGVLPACQAGVKTATNTVVVPIYVTETPGNLVEKPTHTATIPAPGAVLVYNPAADPLLIESIISTVEELVIESNLSLDVIEGPSLNKIAEETKIVLGVGPGLEINPLAATFPEAIFVAIGDPQAVSTGNVSVIGDPLLEQKRVSFMAGYLAALVSSDYKVAALVPVNSETGNLKAESFVVGARFFCGYCQPKYPPYYMFPQWDTLSLENGGEGFQPVIDGFIVAGVEVLYVPGELALEEILSYLDEVNLKVIGDMHPDIIRNNWVGTVSSDPALTLRELWPALLVGEPGIQMPAFITLEDTSAGLLSEGRYRLFAEMVSDLQEGLIAPEIAP